MTTPIPATGTQGAFIAGAKAALFAALRAASDAGVLPGFDLSMRVSSAARTFGRAVGGPSAFSPGYILNSADLTNLNAEVAQLALNPAVVAAWNAPVGSGSLALSIDGGLVAVQFNNRDAWFNGDSSNPYQRFVDVHCHTDVKNNDYFGNASECDDYDFSDYDLEGAGQRFWPLLEHTPGCDALVKIMATNGYATKDQRNQCEFINEDGATPRSEFCGFERDAPKVGTRQVGTTTDENGRVGAVWQQGDGTLYSSGPWRCRYNPKDWRAEALRELSFLTAIQPGLRDPEATIDGGPEYGLIKGRALVLALCDQMIKSKFAVKGQWVIQLPGVIEMAQSRWNGKGARPYNGRYQYATCRTSGWVFAFVTPSMMPQFTNDDGSLRIDSMRSGRLYPVFPGELPGVNLSAASDVMNSSGATPDYIKDYMPKGNSKSYWSAKTLMQAPDYLLTTAETFAQQAGEIVVGSMTAIAGVVRWYTSIMKIFTSIASLGVGDLIQGFAKGAIDVIQSGGKSEFTVREILMNDLPIIGSMNTAWKDMEAVGRDTAGNYYAMQARAQEQNVRLTKIDLPVMPPTAVLGVPPLLATPPSASDASWLYYKPLVSNAQINKAPYTYATVGALIAKLQPIVAEVSDGHHLFVDPEKLAVVFRVWGEGTGIVGMVPAPRVGVVVGTGEKRPTPLETQVKTAIGVDWSTWCREYYPHWLAACDIALKVASTADLKLVAQAAADFAPDEIKALPADQTVLPTTPPSAPPKQPGGTRRTPGTRKTPGLLTPVKTGTTAAPAKSNTGLFVAGAALLALLAAKR